MSMFDTLEIDEGSPFVTDVCNREWQVHLKCIGADYRINEDMELLIATVSLKDGVEKGEDDPIYPEDIERGWQKTDVDGNLTLHGRGSAIDLVLDDGDIVDYDPTIVNLV